MTRRLRAMVAVLGLSGFLIAPIAHAAEACPGVASPQGGEDTTLVEARTALLAGGEVDVLAAGTTLAEHGEPLETMRATIAAAVPDAKLRITTLGHHGMTAGELVDVIRAALPGKPYRLVIWQTGTWEAARTLNPEEFQDALEQGAALAQQAGADLVLVDPQFSRFLQANADVDAYLGAMQLVAALPNVGLFHRFAVTHQWADDGSIDVENAPKEDKVAVTERLQRCVGSALADYILAITVNRPP